MTARRAEERSRPDQARGERRTAYEVDEHEQVRDARRCPCSVGRSPRRERTPQHRSEGCRRFGNAAAIIAAVVAAVVAAAVMGAAVGRVGGKRVHPKEEAAERGRAAAGGANEA
jgi:hypothetical protein